MKNKIIISFESFEKKIKSEIVKRRVYLAHKNTTFLYCFCFPCYIYIYFNFELNFKFCFDKSQKFFFSLEAIGVMVTASHNPEQVLSLMQKLYKLCF